MTTGCDFCMSCITLAVDAQTEDGGNPLLLKSLPFVIAIMIFLFVFRRKIKSLKNLGERIDSNTEPAAKQSLIGQSYLKILGTCFAKIMGRRSNYSPQHMRYLSSGFSCEKCHKTLVSKSSMPLVQCYDVNGSAIPLIEARSRGFEFECKECLHRWPLRNDIKTDTGFLGVD